ncbi:hypothetical protein BCR44DRAFT_1444946, partial [Catenaria anguillulae PL171]
MRSCPLAAHSHSHSHSLSQPHSQALPQARTTAMSSHSYAHARTASVGSSSGSSLSQPSLSTSHVVMVMPSAGSHARPRPPHALPPPPLAVQLVEVVVEKTRRRYHIRSTLDLKSDLTRTCSLPNQLALVSSGDSDDDDDGRDDQDDPMDIVGRCSRSASPEPAPPSPRSALNLASMHHHPCALVVGGRPRNRPAVLPHPSSNSLALFGLGSPSKVLFPTVVKSPTKAMVAPCTPQHPKSMLLSHHTPLSPPLDPTSLPLPSSSSSPVHIQEHVMSTPVVNDLRRHHSPLPTPPRDDGHHDVVVPPAAVGDKIASAVGQPPQVDVSAEEQAMRLIQSLLSATAAQQQKQAQQ